MRQLRTAVVLNLESLGPRNFRNPGIEGLPGLPDLGGEASGSMLPPNVNVAANTASARLLRGNQDETRATIWMRFLGRGRDQVI
ncbi:hypothetical protein AAIH70_05580, partial [Neorhizobium sp. BT27B]|uniref:hypothetical protein n=1 Tax=Neorhizobium sp. BT27B TaxID=3142625 RepID=UPI003D273DAA